MHLLDVTMLYAPTSGGVVRYLRAKRAWLRKHTAIRHSLLVPGPADGTAPRASAFCARGRCDGTATAGRWRRGAGRARYVRTGPI